MREIIVATTLIHVNFLGFVVRDDIGYESLPEFSYCSNIRIQPTESKSSIALIHLINLLSSARMERHFQNRND